MNTQLQERMSISEQNLRAINALLLDPESEVMQGFLDVVARYGTPEEINRKAEEARRLPNLLRRLEEIESPYPNDLHWLREQREGGAFVTVPEYRPTTAPSSGWTSSCTTTRTTASRRCSTSIRVQCCPATCCTSWA